MDNCYVGEKHTYKLNQPTYLKYIKFTYIICHLASVSLIGYKLIYIIDLGVLDFVPSVIGLILGLVDAHFSSEYTTKEIKKYLNWHVNLYLNNSILKDNKGVAIDAKSKKIALYRVNKRDVLLVACYAMGELTSKIKIELDERIERKQIESGSYSAKLAGGLVGGVVGAIVAGAATEKYKTTKYTIYKSFTLVVCEKNNEENKYIFDFTLPYECDLNDFNRNEDYIHAKHIDRLINRKYKTVRKSTGSSLVGPKGPGSS